MKVLANLEDDRNHLQTRIYGIETVLHLLETLLDGGVPLPHHLELKNHVLSMNVLHRLKGIDYRYGPIKMPQVVLLSKLKIQGA